MRTFTSRSSSCSFMAILPFALIFVKSLRLLRRTLPPEVANMTKLACASLSSSGSSMTVEIVSPSASGSRLIIALPRACGLPSGSL